MNPLYVPGALSFRSRSPFETRQTPGLSPALLNLPTVEFVNGAPTISGVPLPSSDVQPQDTSGIASPQGDIVPVPSYDQSVYSDAITFGIVFGGAGESLVLRRPQTTRILLLIQNFSVVGNVFYTFDRAADNGLSCIAIGAGGNRLWDSKVPQGDLHVFSSGAGTILLEYMNRDISKLSFR